MRTRVKICGITRPEDGLAAVRQGADAIGLVFYDKSPRAVDTAAARAVVEVLPPFITVVGLFVNAPAQHIAAVLDEVPIDLLQFHGDEVPEDCAGFGRRYIKAIAMRQGVDLAEQALRYQGASALLLDAYSREVPGGSGQVFDWLRVPQGLNQRVVLAGGLNPANVADAIRTVRPFAVDVSSGVEREPGIKDEQKIAEFMRGVASVETK